MTRSTVQKDELKAAFASRLRRLIKSKGWNQSELARRAGTSRDNISNYVRGKTLPGPRHLDLIAKALDRVPSDLLLAAPIDSIDEGLPQFEMKDIGDNFVWFRPNRALPFDIGVKIAELVSSAKFPNR